MKTSIFLKSVYGLCVLFVCCMTIMSSYGQIAIAPSAPYYIDINKAKKSDMFDIQDGIMGLQYHDKYGSLQEILLTVYDWKYEQVGVYSLDKSAGLNHYTVDLNTSLSAPFEQEKVYFCNFNDETGKIYEWMIRFVEKPDTELEANIIVNPKHISCKELENNLVEFYGEIINGRAPYTVSWYVLNSEKTEFLYQPRMEDVLGTGKTAGIEVDKAPAYNVMLDVTDACGNNIRKMVYLTCTDKKRKVNTLFVEPVKNINTQVGKPTQ